MRVRDLRWSGYSPAIISGHDGAVAEPAHVRRRQSQVLEQGHDVLGVLLVEVLEGVAVVRPAVAQEVRDNHLVVRCKLVDLMPKVGAAGAQRAVKEHQRRSISLHNAVQTPVLCHNIHLSRLLDRMSFCTSLASVPRRDKRRRKASAVLPRVWNVYHKELGGIPRYYQLRRFRLAQVLLHVDGLRRHVQEVSRLCD